MVNVSVIAELCIYILTWNVGTHYPDDVNMDDMLTLNGTNSCPYGQLPDIYVLGFQEVNLKPKNQFLNLIQDNQWTLKIREHLSDRDYVKLGTEKLQGLLINVWALGKHVEHIDDIETESTKTGFGGLWGNKGAVSLRMSLYGTGTTFVVAHLAAHDEHLKERVIDYNQIIDNHHYKLSKYRTIFDHDFIFWLGDLNFRLNGQDSAWDIRNQIEHGQLEDLFARDQLQMVRESGNAFTLLSEEKPTFAPTFKFNEGTSEYNLKRRPAWCDRILYRVEETKYPDIQLSLKQLSYKSHPQYTLSDHKPVTAEFLLAIKAEHHTSADIYQLTHSASSETPLSSHYANTIMLNVTVVAELCLYLLTWNVATKYPNDVNMSDMLSLNGATSCPGGQLPDLYVLGFQEVNVNLKNQALELFEDNQWTLKIQEHLLPRGYIKVGTEKLQGLLINVWSKAVHQEHIKFIETESTKTGFGGYWGNKGAVSLRMDLYDTGTTFVVAHLAAHDEKLQKRIDDYNTIVQEHHYKSRNYGNIFEHDVVFWSGDLNFRLNGYDTAGTIIKHIKAGQLDELFAKDQLQMVRATGQAFNLLNEAKPPFAPTFKFIEGSMEYNAKRRPAWCDRILYRVSKSKYHNVHLGLQQLSYKSHAQYTQSDHKPVTAEFLLTIQRDELPPYKLAPLGWY